MAKKKISKKNLKKVNGGIIVISKSVMKDEIAPQYNLRNRFVFKRAKAADAKVGDCAFKK